MAGHLLVRLRSDGRVCPVQVNVVLHGGRLVRMVQVATCLPVVRVRVRALRMVVVRVVRRGAVAMLVRVVRVQVRHLLRVVIGGRM